MLHVFSSVLRVASSSQLVWDFPGFPKTSLDLAEKAPYPGKSLSSWQIRLFGCSITHYITNNHLWGEDGGTLNILKFHFQRLVIVSFTLKITINLHTVEQINYLANVRYKSFHSLSVLNSKQQIEIKAITYLFINF